MRESLLGRKDLGSGRHIRTVNRQGQIRAFAIRGSIPFTGFEAAGPRTGRHPCKLRQQRGPFGRPDLTRQDNVVMTVIEPGTSFVYSIPLPTNHPSGVYWCVRALVLAATRRPL